MPEPQRRRPSDPRAETRPPRQRIEQTLVDLVPTRDQDPELWAVHDALTVLDAAQALPMVIRDTFDQILDGQRTGRWDFDQLNKTEKTHVGTLVQINLQKELDLADGVDLDYSIVGIDVDCKWSQRLYGWEIPPEMYKRGAKLALVVWGNDYTSQWAAGLLRIDEAVLRPPGQQRDGKRRLNGQGQGQILWIGSGELMHNTLLHLPQDQRRRILGQRSGQQNVNSLFRELIGVLVNRATVLTVAQQDDCMKRVRDARLHLRKEGVVIFGHYAPHPEWAEHLGLPRPRKGQFVSARLVPVASGAPVVPDTPCISIAGREWRRARPEDSVHEAPKLPHQGMH